MARHTRGILSSVVLQQCSVYPLPEDAGRDETTSTHRIVTTNSPGISYIIVTISRELHFRKRCHFNIIQGVDGMFFLNNERKKE